MNPINPGTDLIICNDLQNDFCRLGNLPITGAEEIIPRLLPILDLFPPEKIYLSIHKHAPGQFRKNPDLRHAISYPPIIEMASEENPHEGEKTLSGVSFGITYEDTFYKYLAGRMAAGENFDGYTKSHCPLVGQNLSMIQNLKLDAEFFQKGIRRIFFAGLNLDPCIKNEAYYLLREKKFEIIILEDLARSYNPGDHYLTMSKLKAAGAQLLPGYYFLPEPPHA